MWGSGRGLKNTRRSISYGLSAGCKMNDIKLSIKYFRGEPTYSVTQNLASSSTNFSQNIDIKRPTSTILFLVGFEF